MRSRSSGPGTAARPPSRTPRWKGAIRRSIRTSPRTRQGFERCFTSSRSRAASAAMSRPRRPAAARGRRAGLLAGHTRMAPRSTTRAWSCSVSSATARRRRARSRQLARQQVRQPVRTDGAVVPILHLNGYKIANPTLLARIPDEELKAFFVGHGYRPHIVAGDEPPAMHQRMAGVMDNVMAGWRPSRKLVRTATRPPALADDRPAKPEGLDRSTRGRRPAGRRQLPLPPGPLRRHAQEPRATWHSSRPGCAAIRPRNCSTSRLPASRDRSATTCRPPAHDRQPARERRAPAPRPRPA